MAAAAPQELGGPRVNLGQVEEQADEQINYLMPTPGEVLEVVSPDHLNAVLYNENYAPNQLMLLMCKARTCRPCKMFAKKFQRLATKYPEVLFLSILGDATMETRGLMVNLGIKVTPTFRVYKQRQLVDTVTGISEETLQRSIDRHYDGCCSLWSMMSVDEDEDEVAEANNT